MIFQASVSGPCFGAQALGVYEEPFNGVNACASGHDGDTFGNIKEDDVCLLVDTNEEGQFTAGEIEVFAVGPALETTE